MRVTGLGLVPLGVAVPAGVCVGFLRLPVRLVSSGRGLVWRPAAVAGWIMGLGGGAAGWAPGVLWVPLVSVRRRLWGGKSVCVCGVGLWMSHRQMPSRCVSWRVFLRRLRTYEWSWGAGRLPGWTPRGWSASASMASHAACGIFPSHRLEAAVLHRTLAGPVDQALEGRLCPGPLSQLPELRVGPAPPPLSLGGAAVLGGGVGVRGCDGVVGTGGGGGPGGFHVVLCRWGARRVGARADVDSPVCTYGLRLRVGLGFAVAAVAGHVLYVG